MMRARPRYGIAVIEEAGLPRRGAVHLVGFLPRLHMRIDGAASGGGGQHLRIARLWDYVPSGAGDEGTNEMEDDDYEADRS